MDNIKLITKSASLHNVYEIYDGVEQVNKVPVLTYIIFNAFDLTIKRLIDVDSKYIFKPIRNCYVGQDYYLVYEKPQLQTLTEFSFDNPINEELAWNIMRQMTLIVNAFKQKALVLNLIDPDFIYIDKDYNLKFLSIQAVTDADDKIKLSYLNINDQFDITYPHQVDVQQLGLMMIQLMLNNKLKQKQLFKTLPRFIDVEHYITELKQLNYSDQLLVLLESTLITTAQHRIHPEILLQHPIMFTQEKKNAIINFENHQFKLEEFRFEKNLGEGSFGSCDLAIFLPTGEPVVIKSTMYRQSQDIECEILSKLFHPAIVSFYGSFEQNRMYYMILQFCEQGDLFGYLTSGKQLETELIWKWLSQMASSLYYLHENSLVHRDIKPQNILISKNMLMLADFGVSKFTKKETDTVVGTPLYFSPEQYFSHPYCFASDVFAMGLVFVNIVQKSHPFKNSKADIDRFFNQLAQNQNCDNFCNKIKDLEMRDIIKRMLRLKPEERITAEQICLSPTIMQYIKQQDMPGPRVCSFFINQRVVKTNSQLPTVFRQVQKCFYEANQRFQQFKTQLGKYYDMATQLMPKYVFALFQKINADENSLYIQYYCQQVCLEQISKTCKFKQNKQIFEIISETLIVKICPIISEFTQDQKVVVPTLYITPAVLLSNMQSIEQDDATIVCSNMIVQDKDSITVQIKSNNVVFMFQKLFGPGLKLVNKKFRGKIQLIGSEQRNSINIDSPHKEIKSIEEYTQSNNLDQELFIKLVFFCFSEKFSRNVFEGQKNVWE
ncbi:Kinase [Hexamita inflata]|uniref:Kinase n=1 Tax=Hexamita inflata TaxID=28002 RepID=A0AA86RNC0_9EUKA|nr:Kinase [Hexamita inflata]